MENEKKTDLIEILPRYILLLIFSHYSKIDLLRNEEKQEIKRENKMAGDYNGRGEDIKTDIDDEEMYLSGIIEEENGYCERVRQLNKLKRINKKWNLFFSSNQMWEKIFSHLVMQIENVNLPEIPVSYSFPTFNRYMNKRNDLLLERIEQINEEIILDVDLINEVRCKMIPEPRVEICSIFKQQKN